MTKYLALGFYALYAGARTYTSGVTQFTQGGKVYDLPYRVYRVRRLLPGWAGAQAVGNFVFLREDMPESLLNHELVHVGQFARYAPWFPVLYLLATLAHGYRDNPFEVEARLYGGG